MTAQEIGNLMNIGLTDIDRYVIIIPLLMIVFFVSAEMLCDTDLSGMSKFLPIDQTTSVSIDGFCYDFDLDDHIFSEVRVASQEIHAGHGSSQTSSSSDDGYATGRLT